MATAGNVTLLEAAKYGNDMLKKGLIETLIQESPFLESLPWMPVSGNALQHFVEEDLPSVAFRNVNESYTASFGTDTAHFWGTAILGGEAIVDNALVDVVGNVVDIKARQSAKLMKANAMTFDDFVINGTGTAKDFKGLKALVAEGFGQSLVNVVNGGALSLDKLDEANDLLRNQGGADVLVTNRFVRRKITSLARSTVTGVSLIDVGTDVFGRQVVSWNGIPIRFLGMKTDGTEILAFNEDPGDAVFDCTSLWFLKYGTDDVCGLMGKGGTFDVKDFGETQAAPVHKLRLEWYPGLAVFNKYSVVRLNSITAA